MERRLGPREFVYEWVDRVWREGDLTAVDEMAHPDCCFTEMAGGSWETTGIDRVKKNVELFRCLLPDMRPMVWQLIEEDDYAAYSAYLDGTISDPAMGEHLVGQTYRIRIMTLATIRDGLVVYGYNFFSSNQPDVRLPGMLPAEQFLEPHLTYEHPDDTDRETARKVLADWIEHAWSADGGTDFSAWLAPDCVLSEMSSTNLETRGAQAIAANLAELRRVIGELTPHIITTVAEDNKAACMFNLRGTVKESLLPTMMVGSRVEIRCMMLATLHGGRIAHAYSFIDFSQLGSALPAP